MVDSALGLGGLRQLWSPGTRKPIGDPAGGPLPDSVSEKTWVDINGVKQGMIVRGESERNPVLLWVHGGPGMPDYLLTKQYPTNLEDLFTVVWWDQRGTALSYDADIPPETMTSSRSSATRSRSPTICGSASTRTGSTCSATPGAV